MNALTPRRVEVPTAFSDFRDLHAGESMVVCGCGHSLNDLPDPRSFLTIGVNDVGRLFDPDYLVVLNTPAQFTGDRYRYVAESRARVVFSHLRPSLAHSRHVGFGLGLRGGVDFANPNVLPYTRNSPYVALGLAVHMGARRIGLIGVDFTLNHFFGATGRHSLAREFDQIDREYRALGEALAARGIEVFNLSGESRLTAFPKLSPHAFAGRAKSRRSLNVVSYATTPVAGVPPVLARCIEAQTVHRARTVWATDDYGNGVKFTGDVEWSRDPKSAADLIEAADLVIVHNGRVEARHPQVKGKPTLTLAHNYMWNVDQSLVRAGAPGLVVGQYQAAEPEFAGWAAVPNPVPLWEDDFSPAAKGDRICIAFTPSGRHESYPREHRLYWHGKGYDSTIRVLDRLSARYGVEIAAIRGQQVSHAQSMAMKRRAHIVIDECVTGSYHRNSLEGLAAGAVVINGLGLVPEIAEVFRRMAPGADRIPFETASLDTLEETLVRLIELGPEALARQGEANRAWMVRHWAFGDQWRRFWLPAVDRVLQRTERAMNDLSRMPRPRPAAPARPTGFPPITHALAADLTAPEFAAFNAGHDYPSMRRWELPFAWVAGRFGPIDRVIDCSINPCDLGDRLSDLHPNLSYRHIPAIAGDRFSPPLDAPDGSADRVVCLNTLEHLLLEQRQAQMADMARLLRPGGRLVVTCDHYFDDTWDRRALRAQGLVRADRSEVFKGWNRVTPAELAAMAEATGLELEGEVPPVPDHGDRRLYLNHEAYGHASLGAVFRKPGADAAGVTVALCLLAFDRNAALSEALPAMTAEAALLRRFGHRTKLLVCDARRNPQEPAASTEPDEARHVRAGGADLAAAARAAIDAALADGADYILLGSAGLSAPAGAVHAMLCRLQGLSGRIIGVSANVPRRPIADPAPVFSLAAAEAGPGAPDWTLLRAAPFRAGAEPARDWRPSGDGRPDFGRLAATDAPLWRLEPDPEAPQPVAIEGIRPPGAPITIARSADLRKPEFVAFNDRHNYPRMRRWELPYALFSSRLDDGHTLLDCSHNSSDLGARVKALYPKVDYHRWTPLKGDAFERLPDEGERYDRAICINVLEHLEPAQQADLMSDLARGLRPGGRLVVTCDAYLDRFWDDPRLLAMQVVRADRKPFLGGWNKVTPKRLLSLGRDAGLTPLGDLDAAPPHEPNEGDPDLYRNQEPYPHATIGCVFEKPGVSATPFRRRRIVLSQLSWNTRDISAEAAGALLREAAMLRRLGHEAVVCICDNGSTDGAPAAFRALEPEDGVPLHLIENTENLGNCVARNQIVDFLQSWGGDYLLMSDSDIEIVPFSSFAMLRHLEDAGPSLGCIGAWSAGHAPHRARTASSVYSLAGRPIIDTQMIAFTQLGMFRREVFDAGVRFEEADPFRGPGWGFEDNDLAFQMVTKGFGIQFWKGSTYLHRNLRSSVPIMRRNGHDPNDLFRRRKEHVLTKWAGVPAIAEDLLPVLKGVNLRL